MTVAAPLVAELLPRPGLVVLVTSRTALHLSGEHEFSVPPLPTPPTRRADGPHSPTAAYASVRLFVERARAAAPGFELTSENAAAVAEICRSAGRAAAGHRAGGRGPLTPQALLARLTTG